MTAESQNMKDIERAIERMDDIHSGRLFFIELNSRPSKRKGTYQNYALKSYGMLRCAPSGKEYQVRGTNIIADERSLTFTLRLTPTQSVFFGAANDPEFAAWTTALKGVYDQVTDDVFLVNRTRPLVRGGNCSVYPGIRESDGFNIVTKALSKKNGTKIAALAEAKVGTMLKAIDKNKYPKQLVRVLDVYYTANEAHVVMERLWGRTLDSWLREHGRMSEVMAKGLLLQMLRAIDFLHKSHIIHGAICPRNILILNQSDDAHQGELNIKLIGFHAASWREWWSEHGIYYFPRRPLSEYQRCLKKDGLEYIAPELWQGLPAIRQVDYWALGCTLYSMLIGRLPFAVSDLRLWEYGQGPRDTMRRFAEEEKLHRSRRLLLPEDCERVRALTPNAKSLLFQLMWPDPEQRMNNCDGIENHPWMACAPFPPHWKKDWGVETTG